MKKGGDIKLLLAYSDTILLLTVFVFGRIPVYHIQQPSHYCCTACDTDDDTPEHRIVIHLHSPQSVFKNTAQGMMPRACIRRLLCRHCRSSGCIGLTAAKLVNIDGQFLDIGIAQFSSRRETWHDGGTRLGIAGIHAIGNGAFNAFQ